MKIEREIYNIFHTNVAQKKQHALNLLDYENRHVRPWCVDFHAHIIFEERENSALRYVLYFIHSFNVKYLQIKMSTHMAALGRSFFLTRAARL